MITQLTKYIGNAASELLSSPPFSGWHVIRSVEHEPTEEIWYEFEGRGVEVVCDTREQVRTIFLHQGDAESMLNLPFSTSREEVLKRFGVPEKSGGGVRIAGIGERGPWDRFRLSEGMVHVQYALDRDEIDMVTLMHSDAAP